MCPTEDEITAMGVSWAANWNPVEWTMVAARAVAFRNHKFIRAASPDRVLVDGNLYFGTNRNRTLFYRCHVFKLTIRQ